MNKYLFVYGTLMSTFDNLAAQKLRAEANFIGKASIKGSLYRLENYPAAVFDSKSRIYGELYELHDVNSFNWLDHLEEVPVLYVRRIVKARCNDTKIKCNVYEFAGHVYQYSKIESGDYLDLMAI